MKNWMFALTGPLAGLSLAMIGMGCGSGQTEGGECQYAQVPGTCRIVDIRTASEDLYNCAEDPVEVVFEFAPDSGGQPAEEDHVTIAGGANPPRACVDAAGISVGASYDCHRDEITRGTCTPVIHRIDQIEQALASCECQ